MIKAILLLANMLQKPPATENLIQSCIVKFNEV